MIFPLTGVIFRQTGSQTFWSSLNKGNITDYIPTKSLWSAVCILPSVFYPPVCRTSTVRSLHFTLAGSVSKDWVVSRKQVKPTCETKFQFDLETVENEPLHELNPMYLCA